MHFDEKDQAAKSNATWQKYTKDKWGYMMKSIWISHYHQINEIAQTNPDSVLEVGVGIGLCGLVLTHYYDNINYESIDINPDLNPTHLGSVLKMPFADNSFDTVCCFQVLEHLPFENFEEGLKEIFRVAKNAVVLSLPNASTIECIKLPKVKAIRLEKFWKRNRKPACPSHYWEINTKNVPYSVVMQSISNAKPDKWDLYKNYRIPDMTYHHFFIFKKNSCEGT